MTFKNIRILLLLLVLFYVAFDRLLIDKRTTSWKRTLRVVVYPINADNSPASSDYIKTINRSQFSDINDVVTREASRYGLNLSSPITIDIAPEIKERPPATPNGTGLSVMLWSLKLRYWSWKNDNYKGPSPQIKAFALYFDPQKFNALPHSTGLKEGKITLMNLFANRKNAKQNNVVFLHELLHTLGATDKYDLSTGLPIFPDGFADPTKQPSYPQTKAEIMGGRIALSPSKALIPLGVTKTVIGAKTAQEIGWGR